MPRSGPIAKIKPAKAAQEVIAPAKPKRAPSPGSFKKGNQLGKATQFKKGGDNPRPEPKYKITPEFLNNVKNLGKLNLTYEDCAVFLGMSHQNFGRLMREKEAVKNAYEEGKTNYRMSLRTKQRQLAEQGNVAMLIFLGKNDLGQSDRQELSGKDGGPVEIRFIEGDEDL